MRQLFESLQLRLHTRDRIIADRTWAKDGSILHSDPFSRLYYLYSGIGEIFNGRERTELLPRRLYLIPAYTAYRYRSVETMDLFFQHLSATLAGCGPLHQFVTWPIGVDVQDLKWVEDRLEALMVEPDEQSYLMRDGAVRQLLGLFDEAAGSDQQLLSGAGRFLPVLRHVEANLSGRIYLADLAELIHLEPNYFSSLFRKQFGEAPSRYLQRRRVERAAELLAVSDVSLKELADDLGFTDAFHFSRTFKSFMGVAPSLYRASLMRDG